MRSFRGFGTARPSRAMSRLTAFIGIGMIACVILLFISPLVGGVLFVALWLATAVAVVVYHVRNATSRDGVPHTELRVEGDGARTDFADRLRELEKLRDEGLITDEEYRQKRAQIMGADW
jgi:hypothetical protein